jgi:hypothetical protein
MVGVIGSRAITLDRGDVVDTGGANGVDTLAESQHIDLLVADGNIHGAFIYRSLFGSREIRARAKDAAMVYAFKKFGRRSEFFRALIGGAAAALGCDLIVACPGCTPDVSHLQKLFGRTIIRRITAVYPRKYRHSAEISAEETATLEIDCDALSGVVARRILLVDDVATTGRNLRFVADLLLRRSRSSAEVVLFALGLSAKLKPAPSGLAINVDADVAVDADVEDLFDTVTDDDNNTGGRASLFDAAAGGTMSVDASARVAAVRKMLERGRTVPMDRFEDAVASLVRTGNDLAASKLEDLLASHVNGLIHGGVRRVNDDLIDWYRQVDPEGVAAWEGTAGAAQSAPPKSGADRKAESLSRRTSIPQLPPPADAARRELCRVDLAAFGRVYCGMFLEHPPSARMMPFITSLQNAIIGSGLTHVRWPRGKGKTTWCKIALMWASLYGHRRYLVVVSAAQPQADQIISEVWDALEDGDELGGDFPEASIPVRSINGKIQRCAGQTYAPTGRPTRIRKSSSLIDFPSIDGYPCSGVRIQARGIDASTRGLVNKTVRPDFLLVDDPQTDETAHSPTITRAYEVKIGKTFLGLMGHTRNMTAAMTSTVITAGDLSDRFANTNLHPEWMTHTARLLESFPRAYKTDNDPWQVYFDLRSQDIAHGDTLTYPLSNAYYSAHREDMDAGAAVMDELDGDPATETSAVQHAMNLLYTLGDDAFASEYQLEPLRSASVFELYPERVTGAVNGLPAKTLPAQCDALVAGIDVMREKGLRWTIVAFGPDRIGAVVAYGRFPANGQPLWSANAKEDDRDTALDLALRVICTEFSRLRFGRADGSAGYRVSAVAIDAGYMPKTITRFCSKYAALFQRIETMRGLAWSKFAPFRADGKKRGNVRSADEWAYSAATDSGKHLYFHSDFWREEQQRSWLAAPLQSGSLSVYGARPEAHHSFALEVCGDRLLDKDQTVEGRGIWTWAKAGENHYGDCLTMCFALAYWHKLYTLYERRETAASVSQHVQPPPSPAPPSGRVAVRRGLPAAPRGRLAVVER